MSYSRLSIVVVADRRIHRVRLVATIFYLFVLSMSCSVMGLTGSGKSTVSGVFWMLVSRGKADSSNVAIVYQSRGSAAG